MATKDPEEQAQECPASPFKAEHHDWQRLTGTFRVTTY